MSKLASLLGQLEERWNARGFPAAPRGIRPGRFLGEVREAFAREGLPVPEEVVDWFAWNDGFEPGSMTPWLVPLAAVPLGLDSALGGHRTIMRETEWSRTWVPLDVEFAICVDVAADPTVAPVYLHEPANPDWSQGQLAPSLASVVEAWIEVLDGGWQLEPQGYCEFNNNPDMPEELARRALII